MRTLVGVLLLFACFVCVHVSALHHDELNALEMGGSMLEQPAATTSSSSAPAAASSQNQTQAAVAVNENAPPAGWTPPETLKERADRIQREVIARMHGNHTHHHHHRHHRRHHHHGHHNSTRRHHHIGFEGQFEKGMPVIWAVTRQGRVLSRVNGVHRHAAWRKHKGPRRFRKVVQGPNGAVYALTPSGEVLRRANITAKHPSGKGWKKLIGNLRSLAVTKRGALWGTNARNRVFFKSAKKGSSWKKVRGARLTSIAAGGKKLIVGINKEGKLVIREGISKTNVTGTKWTVQKVDEPVLKRVAAGRKGQLWAIDHEGDIYYKRNLTAEWVKIEAPAKAKSIVVAADGGVAVVSRNFELFSRAGINTTKAIGKGKFWNKVPRSAKLHFTSVGVGPSLKPKKGSRLGKGKKHKKHHKGKKGKKHHKKGKLGKGRSRTFTLRFRQPKESWKQNKTATRVPKALAALIKIYKKRIKLVSVHRVQKADGTKSKKRSIATFKLFRHNATAVALDTKNSSYVPREISPRKALGKLKIALRNATRVAKYPALKYVDAASLMRIKRNGKAVLVTAPASHGRRYLPSNAAHSHKLKVSHIVFRNNVRFVFGASKNLTADGFQQLVLTKRAKGRKSQKWTMSNSGQIYFKNAEGERMCLETQKHARKGTSLKLVVCSTSRDDKQLFQYSHKNGFVRHMASGRCLTAGSKSPKKSHLIKLGKCRRASHKLFKRKADARQQFKFVASKHQPKKGKKRSLIPEFPDRNLTFYVEFDRAFETLPADFNVTLGTDLSRAVGIGKSRVRVKKLSAVTTATPQINTGALIKFKAAEDDSGDIYTLPAYKAVRRALNNTKSELRGRDTWHTAIFKTLKIVSQSAYPKADNTSSKIEFFLAPGNVLDGAFGGKPGAHLAIASRNPLSSSQKWFYNKLVGRVYIRVDDQKYCITTSKNATAGSSLRTKECLATDDDDIHRQQFTYSSATQSFVHRYSELCLELPSRNTAGGTRIRLAKCGPASNAQAWDFPASYPKHLRKALKKARAAEKKVEKAALKALEKQMRQEAKEKQEVENQKQKANEAAAAAKVAEQKRVAAKAERVKFMTLRKTLKKNHYERKVQRTAFGNSGKFSCRDLSNYFGITHAQSIGYHTPALYRAAWTAKKCSTKPLSCQELTDCYDFENMNENNAWALRNGFKPGVNNSDSFKFAPILVAQRYFGLFKHAKHAHGFHGANEHYVNGTNTEERHNHTHASHDHHEDHSHAREHSHRRQCKGFYPLDCQQMSDYYGISRLFAGTAPKCVQKKFKVLGCTTHPEQTCQILSNRFGLASNATDAPSNSTKSAKASKASSPRFMQLAADAVPAAATYIAPKEAQDAFETHQCKTKPEKCQTISDRFQTWAGHKGKASKDTYRQFLLRACTTRPRLSCAQLSDSFGFGSRTRHPKPEEHGQTVDTLGAASFAQHLALSNDTEPTSFMEVSSSMGYNTNSLRNAPLRKIPAAYFVQWTKQQCTTRPHKCQQLSNIYGISPNSRGAASKAIARSFTAVKKCATHPLLSCQELSNIYGLTTETAGFTAEYLQKQWRSQNCSTSISTCQELSDQYDLPNGEWASYAPKGVRAQFKAYQCKTSPLPTCQALSDYYFINHAQIDPSLHSEVGIADRLILAKYSRWGCHHQYRDCQDISNFYNIGRNAKGKIQTNNLTPSFARAIYEFRQCGTSPLPGNVPGTADQPTA